MTMIHNPVYSTGTPCTGPCDGLRTQTQGGWGAPPRGGNNGAYLYANFEDAFPGGVVIGDVSTTDVCTGNRLILTTPEAVTDFLPSGSTARALGGNYTNPGGSYNNVLAGQAVALTISIGFDNTFADFAPSTTNLEDAIVAEGTFAGWTVAEVLAEANRALAGCGSSYSFSQLNDALSRINESFTDGVRRSNYLVCPRPVPAQPSLSATQPTCEVKTGTITVTAPLGAGYTYSLDNGPFVASTVFSGLAPGNHCVRVKDAYGCISKPRCVTINPVPALTATPILKVVQPTCEVMTGTIKVVSPTGAGISYSIDGSTWQASPVFAGLAPGNYCVRARTNGTCVSQPVCVTINPVPAKPAKPALTAKHPTCETPYGVVTVTAPLGAYYTYSID
ncbi:hypothetical protein ACFS7Z_07730, partial [Pontibacter toksunensis]